MFSPVSTSLVLLLLSATTSIQGFENFNATFGSSPQPFEIDVDPGFIEETRLKASLTRYAVDIEIADFEDGPPRHNVSTVRDFWVDEYDWEEVQDELNQNYTQFTTTVTTGPNSNFTDPVLLHFVYHRSNRSDAIPLLFIHGWPGSFMEVGPIINQLTNPPDPSNPAFHVIAPSLPGFGFSPAPKIPGMGPREVGQALNNLMTSPQQLNFPKYVIQAGDWGGFILRFMAGDFPDSVVSVLSNFWVIWPNATDLARFEEGVTTADENTTITNIGDYLALESGYKEIQSRSPLQLAIAMGDSPVGFAMWIYELMHEAVDRYVWTPKTIITWAMMYYIQGPYGGMRLYKESIPEGVWTGNGGAPFVTQPAAISEFLKDIWFGTPLDWAQRAGNVVQRVVHNEGGHFSAIESPELLLQDIWTFWGNDSLSNVGVFKR